MKVSAEYKPADFLSISADVRLGQNVKLGKFINLYGCEVGDNTKIGVYNGTSKPKA